MQKHMLIIFGPTGVGKSDFAERVAQHVPAEIVNMDVGQLYTPLTIGTAKPDWQSATVPHHLFDRMDTPEDYSVTQYRQDLIGIMNNLWSKGKLPIVVGGSGFYLKSLFFPPTAPTVQNDQSPKRVVTPDNVAVAWHELQSIDPERAAAIDKNDTYRIARALTIWDQTGVKPSQQIRTYQPPASFTLLFLTRDKDELYARINDRVDLMMDQGWLDEVDPLRGTDWESFLLKKKLIGYNELLSYNANNSDPEHLRSTVDTIKQRTRHYAKRQHTFWRMLKQKIDGEIGVASPHGNSSADLINLTLLNIDLYIKLLSEKLLTHMNVR